ncbi:SAV_2336 N-terminal domain-related protein [Streptomyces sp. b84]|uniref:SAV_2336 N-terminal domain-related protein n=1 Tax=Streptomyces sp. b84 TaxID=1827631 RepID=UPI00211D474D|nr:SAV_2336 N-terminal domain-related protein [Streptomyces sp. b84]
MAEGAAARLARLALAGSGDIDVKELLDAVLLASAWAHADWGPGSPSANAADPTAHRRKQGQADTTALAEDTQALGSGSATDTAHEPVASVWLGDQGGSHTVPGKRVSVGRADALPDALEIGRALRPLRRPWLSGVHHRLDVNATVEHYTRTGMLIPRLTPAPEPWLEVIIVLDRGTAMAVWDETVRALTKMLRALAAFRDVRVWHLEHPADDTPVLHDHHGSALSMHPDAAHHTQPTRRLLLVVSDCAAPAWRQDALWQTLHTWGRTAPVALINPLPKRLWQRSGLDLPHTTATATVPASPGRLLSYRRPRLLREAENTKPWQALPVLQLAPDQVLAWARTLMRTDPSGCEAVLIPATGRPPLRRHQQGPTGQPDAAPTSDQVRAHAEAFTDDRQSLAVRLAIAASPLDSFTLPILDALRDRLVPAATLADTAEFLTAGLLTATRCESADTLYHFHPAAAAHLTRLLTRDQLWDTHFALSDHLAAHLQTPHGIPVVLHSPHVSETLPTGIRPIAYAAATTARLLGVDTTDSLPETMRRPAAGLTAESSSEPQRGAAPAVPENSPQATELYLTLARLFRSLIARASDSRPIRPSEPRQHEALMRSEGGSRHGRQRTWENDDAPEITDTRYVRYELVISVDLRRSGAYDDVEKSRMRVQLHRMLETAFTRANVALSAVHMEDRGDGILVSVGDQIPVTQLLGLWLVEVHENLRDENHGLHAPLGLRIGMHFGPVRHDDRGIIGRAVDLACRLADSAVARQLLDAERADLVLVTSQSLYEDVIMHGGRFIAPERYSSARLELKEGEVTAWFHLPGRPAPEIPAALTQRKKPEELASIVQDLTTLLENTFSILNRGRYLDRTSGKKIAGLLRAVADQLDVYGNTSPSHDTAPSTSAAYRSSP